jgi:hypothetical protein
VGLFLFWLILPYLIASAVSSVHKKLDEAENPDKEALKIGRSIAEELRDALRPALQGAQHD